MYIGVTNAKETIKNEFSLNFCLKLSLKSVSALSMIELQTIVTLFSNLDKKSNIFR